jgi:hypothetical protein
MNRADITNHPPQAPGSGENLRTPQPTAADCGPSPAAAIATRILLALFGLASVLGGIAVAFGTRLPPALLTAFLGLAAATLIASNARALPFQNVMLAAAAMGGTGLAAAAAGTLLQRDINPVPGVGASDAGLFVGMLIFAALLWIVLLLAARGAALRALRAWRDEKNYGLWNLALTAALAVCLVANSRPLLYSALFVPLEISVAPSTTFIRLLAWLGTAVVALLAGTPSLLDKRTPHVPGAAPARADGPSIVVWLALHAFFTLAAARHESWGYALVPPAVALLLLLGLATAAGRRARVNPLK